MTDTTPETAGYIPHRPDPFGAPVGPTVPNLVPPAEVLRLAVLFHEIYERLAPSFGYETRADTKVFDPTTPNGRLMVAVCGELAGALHNEHA